MKSLTFKLTSQLRAALEAAALKEGRTLSDFIRRHFARILRVACAKAKKKGGKAK
jgi:uncharacterized protein (DUF1778 family)